MNKNRLFYILPFLLLSSCFGTFSEGERLFRNQEYQKAISEFSKVLFISSTDLKSLHLRARAHEELEEYDEAIADYKTITKLKPNYAQAYAGIGKIRWKQENYVEAEKFLLIAAMHDSEDYEILFLLGRAMIMNKNYRSADEFLEIAKKIKPKEANLHFYQGIARAHSGDPLGCAASFNTYLKYASDNLTARYNRGWALMRIGYLEWAIEDFDEVLKAKPKHYEAMARRAYCYMEQDQAKACRELQTAAQGGSQFALKHLADCN
ncbi:tetratricopeptide repeat protein [Pararhodonellum marinum]|uniref:tetratricopeptide repeat protein n=1 Tax=Pararhodonellum marinum TaxID=2755358 RepID=UPI00189036BB|nr:tetratricopeptide repeat protein [Pararhodonellum marinum]